LPLLTAFDFPDVDASCEARFITTQPQQSLSMLNGQFLNDQASYLASRVRGTVRDDERKQVSQAIEYALSRVATEHEVAEGLSLMKRLQGEHSQSREAALRFWCLTVLNLNEFVYLD
jgi:hypothetical protein